MNDLMPFDYQGTQMRTVLIDGDHWFVAADVARILGYRDAHNLCRRLDEDDRGTRSVSTPSGDQDMTVISEPGLYAAVLGSQVEGARAFKRWVTREVLPSLRKTGSYEVQRLTPLQLAERLVDAELRVIAAQERNTVLSGEVAQLTPKAEMFDGFLSTTGDYSVNEAAKCLARVGVLTGQNRLFKQMSDAGWAYRDAKGDWLPYQQHIDNGRLRVKARWYFHPVTGERIADTPQIRVTAKGLAALRDSLTAAVSA